MYSVSVAALLLLFVALAIGAPPKERPQIAFGKQTQPDEFPFQAFLYIYQDTGSLFPRGGMCGGSLIHPEWVLTAAHCTVHGNATRVQLGSNDLLTMSYRRVSHKIFMHEGFNPATLENDIALIKLPVPAKGIPVVRLPSASLHQTFNLTDMSATVIGYGTTEKGPVSSFLLKATLRTMTRERCESRMSNKSKIILTEKTLCAANEDLSGVCAGDSGGPLLMETLNGPIQIGITSWASSPKCKKSLKSGFVLVSYFVDWIKGVMEKEATVQQPLEQQKPSTTTTTATTTTTTTQAPPSAPQIFKFPPKFNLLDLLPPPQLVDLNNNFHFQLG